MEKASFDPCGTKAGNILVLTECEGTGPAGAVCVMQKPQWPDRLDRVRNAYIAALENGENVRIVAQGRACADALVLAQMYPVDKLYLIFPRICESAGKSALSWQARTAQTKMNRLARENMFAAVAPVVLVTRSFADADEMRSVRRICEDVLRAGSTECTQYKWQNSPDEGKNHENIVNQAVFACIAEKFV